MSFKTIFPAGYNVENEMNDNIDINIVMENGDVYFGTFFTIQNVQHLLDKDEERCFWAKDMLIVKDLSKKTIREAVARTIKDAYTEMVFTKIGRIETKFRNMSFDDIPDMANGYELDLADD
ncbi:hypothetical protein [uncultured Mucilaginibacter sp.]|uniref:hypothetical protein n=1 Tax=uncultured Mucilaginibacter sp. TaxID=797541 RepID=UPI0025D088D4|nr:hypothetical protein [uncultured Mucilaginibacter sp.]